MIEHIALATLVAAFISLEVRHRVIARRRSQSLASPIAREQKMRRCGL